jgi:soluble lytic murein transglycosylase-like protein
MVWRAAMAAGFGAALAVVLGASSASAYSVERGDTLSGIAIRNGVSVASLKQANGLGSSDRVYAGQQLRIGRPARAPVTRAAALASYTVRPGDTVWTISRATGVPMDTIVRANQLADPNRIRAGQTLDLSRPTGPVAIAQSAAAAPAAGPVRGEAAKRLLVAAAGEQGLNPSFVLAVSLWESGYNQGRVSSAGAVGLMQVLPKTAEWAGPGLLGRRADINDPADNARLGAALLRYYLDQFQDPKLALAAYYQGPAATRAKGVFPSSRQYVDGIWSLRNSLQAST